MKIETLLPLGKLDPGLRTPAAALDITTVYDDARLVEDLGFDRLVVEETKDDPFQVMALAAQATATLGLGTSVAIAFPRSPAVTAMSAWSLQKLSGGRFALGLGPQVRGHIQRRYGLDWHPPGPWMADYVRALRAVWDCWQNGTKLDFESEHYRLNLMVPLFDPGPIDHPEIPIYLAAVGPKMCAAAGAVADGIRPHPVCTPKYIAEVMRPAAAEGANRAGRTLDDFAIAMKPLVATAADDATLETRIEDARARIAFYASTPAYRPAFAIHGLGDLADELSGLSKRQLWDDMPGHITDDILRTFVTIGRHDVIGQKLIERYGDVVTGIEFSIAVSDAADRDRLADLVRAVQTA